MEGRNASRGTDHELQSWEVPLLSPIYDEVQALDYTVAARTSVLLLIFSFVTLALVYALNRRSSLWWSSARNA